MPLAVHRSVPSSNMRPTTQRSTSMPGSYPYPYAYLYTYDTLLNNSLGMSSSIQSASSPRRRRLRTLGTLGLNDNDDRVRRTGTRRAVSSRSLLTRAYTPPPIRPRCSVSDGSTAPRQVLAEIEWWRVVQGQCDTEPDVDLDVEQEDDDQEIGSNPRIDVPSEIEDEDTPVYTPSIPPVARIRSHAHAHDDFTFTHSFSAHSRTSSSSSSDSELEIPNRIPRGIVPFPSAMSSGFDLNSPTTGASIFPPAPVLMMEYDREDDVTIGDLNGIESVPISGSSAIVKAALAALFPSSTSTPPAESTPSPPSQLLALSLSSFSHQNAKGVGIYTPALPQTSRVRSISLPEASNTGSCGMTVKSKHARFAAEANDPILGGAVRNL
ncbi:hypothetical protein Clacol_001255 [Clathrus columnatus]|uniref:Uncharacterized protein n=1 Tax=Clathrus columnatus TaxID=1419009 RepID=A0AAV5A3B9_9AGAM|nr:hypothetical protein Clacol_001255 [Clathrus columnatus]